MICDAEGQADDSIGVDAIFAWKAIGCWGPQNGNGAANEGAPYNHNLTFLHHTFLLGPILSNF